jgi:shikimate dehydrogenase
MIGSNTMLCCLIGDPVAHSLSPRMMNAAFRELGVDCALPRLQGQPTTALPLQSQGCARWGYWVATMTIPHKTGVASHLDRLTRAPPPRGRSTVISNSRGELVGHNTDGMGAREGTRGGGARLKGAWVLILG